MQGPQRKHLTANGLHVKDAAAIGLVISALQESEINTNIDKI